MSHVSRIELHIKDLACLRLAAADLGLTLVEGQTTFKSFQHGLRCDHVIRDESNPHAYEIGVTKRADGKGFDLMYDDWAGGGGMAQKIGQNASLLKQQYSFQTAAKTMRAQGYRVEGKPRLTTDGRMIFSMAK